MKNKTVIIINIVLLCVVIVFLLFFMIFGMNGHFFFAGHTKIIWENTFLKQDIQEVFIDVDSFDIDIKEGDVEDVKVTISGREKMKKNISVRLHNQTLSIKQNGISFCFGFCYGNAKIEVILPKNHNYLFDLKSTSGDIQVLSNLLHGNHKVTSTSGDIRLKNMSEGNIKTTSGDITISSLEKGNIVSTSGDISVDSLNQVNVKSTSGEIDIKKMNGYGDIKTTSGDITISSFLITNHSHIQSTSGDVLIYLLNEAIIHASSVSGDKDIKPSAGEYKMDIKTTSGDISVH